MTEYKANGVIGDYLIYRDKPLVRQGNMYCYGDMKDEYVLFLMVFTTKKSEIGGEEIPDHILVQVMSTDESKSPTERLAKQFEKNGLYDALDIGIYWLDKLNGK
ncbi:MAG: hypothetical protein IJD10_02070 [Clostridia bacterium]|nr:hypothetical protein [Clostridia bacterium]